MKKSTANHMHGKRRKNNLTWLFALLGILVLFLGTILAFLIFSNLSSKPTETVQEVSAVNVEKDIPETDMGDLIYHEPAAENVVMQGGFGYVNNELLVTLDSSDSLSALKDYLRTISGEVVGEIPVTADYQILLPDTHTQEELEQMIEQLKALPYVRRSSLNYAFELENDAISGSSAYYPNDKKWDDWSGNSGNNWNMKAIDAPGAWVYHDQMQPVNVGIIEELFDPYHEDLSFEEMPFGNISAMGPYKYNGLGWWTSKQSHGTHVAGIIGATFDNGKGVCGVAPNAKLYGANWKNGDGGKFYYTQKAALGYLVQKKHCRVLNLSFSIGGYGLRYSASQGGKKAQENFNILNADLTEFLDDLEKNTGNSFLICKSADNDNDKLFYKKDKEDVKNGIEYFWQGDYKKDPDYNKYKNRFKKDEWVSGGTDARWDIYSGIDEPEIKDSIIVVGAAAVSGTHSYFGCKHNGYQVASYSNRGSRVDVLAPGGSDSDNVFPDAKIYSTVADGAVGYGYKVGTSMATPHVAGVAAMIFGIDPTFTAKEVKDIIISTATGSYGSVKEQYPLLNARLAVEKAIKLSNEKAKGQTGDDLPFEPSGEHQYKIFYDTLTWEEAKAACEAKGGHLATITSEEEQQKLNLYNAGNHNLWIGGYKNADGQWCWVNGEPWTYENWGDGEPNNSSNVVAGESCVAMWPEKWNDLANSNTYEQSGYICEWEASDVAEETQVEGYTGHLYEFYTLPESEWESGPITWQQAERRCEWKGGHLAVIESSTENFLLYSAMKAKGYENAYFGFSDESSEGNWKWVDGTSTAYTNWHSGEPNNQDGIEHYAMFYEKFQDGTWNDADGIIDAGCAYICEWDDPTDKISQGDSFTDRQLRIIAKDLGVPDDLNVEIRQSPKAYWESAGLWDIYVEITHNGKLVASGSFDVETGEMGRNIYIYTPV
jgi:subtilisin family serine protease